MTNNRRLEPGQTPISDERIAELVRNDPLAYRWFCLAAHNGLSEVQFLTELLLAKFNLPAHVLAGELPTYEESKKQADEFAKRYGLRETR